MTSWASMSTSSRSGRFWNETTRSEATPSRCKPIRRSRRRVIRDRPQRRSSALHRTVPRQILQPVQTPTPTLKLTG